MITWVTVWVLTVHGVDKGYRETGSYIYQLSYATQALCEKQKKNHERGGRDWKKARCDFQQVPVVMPKK